MTRYNILSVDMRWHSTAVNEAGKPFDVYTASFVPQGTLEAPTVEQALKGAKALGHVAPVVERVREPLQ